jgi:hypothetical protein
MNTIPMKKQTNKQEPGNIDYEQLKWILHEVNLISLLLIQITSFFFVYLEWAVKLTEMADGKHHIGDFIPAHELEKFMKTYSVS